MAGTMKAAVLREIGTPLRIEMLPIPTPQRGEVLIKVEACGVCHSDLHAIEGDWSPLPNLPLIPGHEVIGTVAALGSGVDHFKLGDRIGVPWLYSACGHCEFCLSGMETICLKAEATGYSKPGGYAEYSGDQMLPSLTTGAPSEPVGGVTLLGAHLSRRLPWGLELALGVRNLSKVRLAEVSPLFTHVEAPRTWRLTLRGRW